ncbi:MAG: hypothetical protein J5I98_01840 [Phaeodactylibacter sp.]|nr:hypothetical protein [Phaeodactylibacter sp.]
MGKAMPDSVREGLSPISYLYGCTPGGDILSGVFTTFYFNIKDGKLAPPLRSRLKTYLFGIGRNYHPRNTPATLSGREDLFREGFNAYSEKDFPAAIAFFSRVFIVSVAVPGAFGSESITTGMVSGQSQGGSSQPIACAATAWATDILAISYASSLVSS